VSGRPGWGKIAVLLAKIVLSIGLLAFLVQRVRWDQVAATLARTDERWMTAAICLMLLSNVIGSWQWSQLLRVVDIRIPFWKVCTYYHVGLFFNNLLPANIGGDFFRVADASRYGTTRTAALSAVLMDRLVNTLALGGLALPTTLQARASSAGGTAASATPTDVGGSAAPTTLLTYNGPISNDGVTVAFRQHINANDALRTGTYSKTLTFTLATTAP